MAKVDPKKVDAHPIDRLAQAIVRNKKKVTPQARKLVSKANPPDKSLYKKAEKPRVVAHGGGSVGRGVWAPKKVAPKKVTASDSPHHATVKMVKSLGREGGGRLLAGLVRLVADDGGYLDGFSNTGNKG